MPELRPGTSPALPWLIAVIVVIGLATFAMTRDEDTPPPPVVTTTTFPREGYIDAISAALTKEVRVSLGATGARCIAGAMVDIVGTERLEALAEETAPLAALTAVERERMLRIVVTCVDPIVAEALLGSGSDTTRAPVGLPDEGA